MPLLFTAVFMVMAVVPACAQKKGLPKGVKAVLGKKPPLTGAAPVVRLPVSCVPLVLSNAVVAASGVPPAILERQITNTLPKLRLLSAQESKRILFPQAEKGNLFYVPLSLNTPETAVYRGLSLSNLEELENIVKNGLELNKIQVRNATEYAIFTSHRLELALHHALTDEKAAIPVIVKIPVTQQYKPLGYNGHFVFIRDVPAEYISEILALLKINGKAMWYKAIWQEGKMVLIPAPSKQFAADELMIHYFKTWPINLDMD